MSDSNIHDVTLEKSLIPFPRGAWEEYKRLNGLFKIFQRTWHEVNERQRGVSNVHRPNLSNLPVQLKDLPTHFSKKEGRRLTKEVIWPKAGDDIQIECSGENECIIFNLRGYLCKLHNPYLSILPIVEHTKAISDIKTRQKVRVWIT